MDELLINPQTTRNLKQLLKGLPHATLLAGPAGSGKTTLAVAMAEAVLDRKPQTHPYFRLVEAVNGTVPIESVRELQKFMQLRTPGEAAIRRVVVISGAEGLTIEAQNAFLKTLEEPPLDTMIILTAVSTEAMLPTIRSRVAIVPVLPVSQAAAIEYYEARDFPATAIKQAWALSRGQVGMLDGLLNEAEEHELLQHVAYAKALLGKNSFERLCGVDDYAKDKAAIEQLLSALERIAHSALEQAARLHKTDATKRWHAIASQLVRTRRGLERNANAKLLLTDLMLSVS